ncbi:Dual specificity protein kinase pom1 [Ceratocystis platani]|uniref:dual-specificity kinase n=1 Tax=Ceratocystis fimbriata f. sp. platani TaxID=88771 RepID=A0A0F8DK52_CERFI|nr:Dual specificity protein kinase pom1 [Ceratocystis platani]
MHNSSSNNSTTSIATPTPGLASDIPPPPPSERRTSSRSPSILRKATATPSSSRTTPDTHRKSYGSGLSTGSAASVTTVRTSTGSIAPRVPQIPQSMSTSRLPAPKALTLQNIQMQSTANDLDEEVPPVPAIPKAYGSPKEPPAEYGLMDKKKLSMRLETSSAHSLQSNSTGSGSALGLEVASGSTVGSKVGMRKGSYHSQTVRESEKMNQSPYQQNTDHTNDGFKNIFLFSQLRYGYRNARYAQQQLYKFHATPQPYSISCRQHYWFYSHFQGKLSPTASIKSGSTYLETRRRKSSISSLTTIGIGMQERHRGEWASHSGALKKPIMPETSERLAPSNGVRKMKPRTSITPMNKSATTDLWVADMDKDDLLAEEDMRKLAMRRKETEVAARMLDQLRKRANPKERVSSQDAIRIARLNSYEHGEIMDYNDVYFCGTQNAQKVVGDIHGNAPNFGYDDERGDYAIVPGDHLAYRYEIIDILGKGSFGQVVRCIDHCLGVLVAIKIIRNKKRFHQQAIVEVNILKKLREWDPHNHHSMVNFTDKFYFRGHLCISTELLDMNLYEFIKVNNFRGFSLRLIRRFTKQILSSLNLLKHRRVIHCDLKPENILIRHPLHSEIKVIDFGSSCFENEKIYTYIQSRFYRSPEVILGMTYGLPIDMWSVGCILAELYTGVPIFPGENEQEQLACIMEVFGPPEKHLIEKSTRKKLFFDSMGKPRLTVSTKGRRRRPSSKTLQQVLKCDDEPFLDFIARCLRWDPDRRMRPEEAIRHEFITGQKPAPRPPRDMSPMKRTNTIATSRPLPEPPASTFRRTLCWELAAMRHRGSESVQRKATGSYFDKRINGYNVLSTTISW